MSLNTAHADHGVLIHAGEIIILFSDNVSVEFYGNDTPDFKGGIKQGRMYLTSHRMIFNSKNNSDPLRSFSFPFIAMDDVTVEQPMFSANYIKGKIRAQPNGNFIGEVKFKLTFKSGGAIEYGQAMLQAARFGARAGRPVPVETSSRSHARRLSPKNSPRISNGIEATRNLVTDNAPPPPYTPPSGPWYAVPPPAYAPAPQGYYGWVPPYAAFPDQPPPNSVYVTPNPPPYPGLTGDVHAPGQYPSMPSSPTGANSGYPGAPSAPGYPGAPPGYPGAMPPGYPGGFAPPGPTAGMSSNDAKAAEAAQSAYYDPNRPQTAYVPPPYDQPPTYQESTSKKEL